MTLSGNIYLCSNFSGLEMLATAKKAVEVNADMFMLRVMVGQKGVNLTATSGKATIPPLIEHLRNRGIKFGVYATIAGGDVATEYKRLAAIVEPYKGSIDAIGVEVADAWTVRKPAEAVKWCGLVAKSYPSIDRVLIDTTTKPSGENAFIQGVNKIAPLCLWEKKAANPYNAVNAAYGKYLDYGMTLSALDKMFIPMLAIHDISARDYAYNKTRLLSCWQTVANVWPACVLYDWNPTGEGSIGDDGYTVEQALKQMDWPDNSQNGTKPVEEPTDDVETVYLPGVTDTTEQHKLMWADYLKRMGA